MVGTDVNIPVRGTVTEGLSFISDTVLLIDISALGYVFCFILTLVRSQLFLAKTG